MIEYKSGDLQVIPSQNRIAIAGRSKSIQPKILELLLLFCQSNGETLAKQEIVEHLWPDTQVGPDSLVNTITRLRRELNENQQSPTYIETVRGKGYRWLLPVEKVQRDDASSPRFSKKTILSGAVVILLLGFAAIWSFTADEKLVVKEDLITPVEMVEAMKKSLSAPLENTQNEMFELTEEGKMCVKEEKKPIEETSCKNKKVIKWQVTKERAEL